MRIEITTSARQHGITGDEIRAVLTYFALRISVPAKREGAVLFLHIGPATDNSPYLEVLADFADENTAVVFHAMMLRPSLVNSLGIGELLGGISYAPQRK